MDRPLTGIRIIALEQYMAGPYCTMLLADAGAEVIKIERPGSGDPRRSIPPFAEKDGTRKAGGFMAYNRNKKSFCLKMSLKFVLSLMRRLVNVKKTVAFARNLANLRPIAPNMVYWM